MPLFTICNTSLRCPQNVSKFQLKKKNPQIIFISFWMTILSGSRNCFCACRFKCKWDADPRPLFHNWVAPLQLVPSKLSVMIIMFITLKSCVLNHISLNFWYTVSECTHPKHMDRKRLLQHESKPSSHSHKFTLKNTRVTQTVCEGKTAGKEEWHVCIRSVWRQQYTVNKSINPLP